MYNKDIKVIVIVNYIFCQNFFFFHNFCWPINRKATFHVHLILILLVEHWCVSDTLTRRATLRLQLVFIYLSIYIYYQLLLLSWLNIFPSVQGCVVHTSSPDWATLNIAWLSSPRHYTKQKVLSHSFWEVSAFPFGFEKATLQLPEQAKTSRLVKWRGLLRYAVAWSRYMVKVLF